MKKLIQKIDVSVVIVSYNTKEHLKSCLRSLNTYGYSGKSEIFVVDNASEDGSQDMVRVQFPAVNLLENKTNTGFAAAVNQALQLTEGRYVFLLNPDTLIFPDAVDRLVSFLEEHSRAGAVGPRQWLDPEKSLQSTATAKPPNAAVMLARIPFVQRFTRKALYREFWIKDFEVWNSDSPVPVETLNGSSLLIRRKTIQEVGGLDENFFLFFEDVDWCVRMRREGWDLFCVPGAEIVHFGMRSVHSVKNVAEMSEESLNHYITKHWGRGMRFLWSLNSSAKLIKAKMLERVKRNLSPSTATLDKEAFSSDNQEEKTVTFQWEPVGTSSVYCFEISQDPLFLYKAGAIVNEECFTLSAFFVNSWPKGQYFWRFAPVDMKNRLGKFCKAQKFRL